MTKFYFIRHAEPNWSLARSKQLRGLQIEFCPLSWEGTLQAKRIATNPLLKNAEIVISSPYTRALHTAAIVSGELNLPLIVEYDLHERVPDNKLHYTLEELFKNIKKDFEMYNSEQTSGEEKYWETMSSVRNRVEKVLEKYKKNAEVIVVTHGVVISSQVQGVKLHYGEFVEFYT